MGERSWWFADALAAEGGAAPLCRPLSGRATADIAIVGGGYAGLWTALALRTRRPDLSVVLIERDVCGSGASGKNAGKVHGYWSTLPRVAALLGPDAAWTMARLGNRAQDALRQFAKGCGRDVWWQDGGGLKVSAAPGQDAAIASAARAMHDFGAADKALPLSCLEVAEICRSPVFRCGLFYPEEATVHPARLVRALRQSALDAGVVIHEHTAMTGFETGTPNRVRTSDGEVVAREVVLATNVDLLSVTALAPRLVAFSSYALMTAPSPKALDELGWRRECSIVDARSFLHYARKTPDGRVLMGSGSGPIALGARVTGRSLLSDEATVRRAADGLKRLLPSFADMPVDAAWGAGIDVSADRIPFAGTLAGSRVHYACGFSGHGVNPAYILGQCLASLALGTMDDWTLSPFCTRTVPTLPPEPIRYLGGALIRRATLACEAAEEQGRPGLPHHRAIAALPKLLNLTIGTR
jgi:glycine/D-amino acid oxidase-like deaminating enzyme